MCHWNAETNKRGAVPFRSELGTVSYRDEDKGEWVYCLATCRSFLDSRK